MGTSLSGEKNGKPVTVLVLNCSAGFFKDPSQNIRKGESLIADGYTFRSRTKGQIPKETSSLMGDGTCVHPTEIMSNLILRNMDRGLDAPFAMEAAMEEFPKECVKLLLSVERPGRIAYSRFNMPMNLGFADHGCYMASAALCFPDDASDPLPAGSVGYVYPDHYESYPYKKLPATVAPITARIRKEGYDVVIDALRKGNQTLPMLAEAVAPLFDPADCVQKAMLVYDIFYILHREGKLTLEIKRVLGVLPGQTAPQFRMGLK